MTLANIHSSEDTLRHVATMQQEVESTIDDLSTGVVFIRVFFGLLALGLALAPFVVAHHLKSSERAERLEKMRHHEQAADRGIQLVISTNR